MIVLVVASIALMTTDHRNRHLEGVRTVIATVVYPLQALVNLPSTFGGWLGESLTSRQLLLEENRRLREGEIEASLRLQRLASLERENERLRKLLASSRKVEGLRYVIAELLAVDVDPYNHQVLINKGLRDDIYLGQPLFAAEGVMGQIVHLNPLSSSAILITDPSHALPVELNRNGMRTLARGTGISGHLSLPHIPNDADIRVGDLLVTSGLGGRFPPGYPVATVEAIERDPGSPFARITAVTSAPLDKSHEALLVWHQPEDPLRSVEPATVGEPDAGAPAGSEAAP